MNAKEVAGVKAAEFVKDGMTVGLGTGSTVYWTIRRLGERVHTGLRIRGIPTSQRTEELARELEIPLVSFEEVAELDVTIDGADEVTATLDLIKGGGGALLREKLVAAASRHLVIVVDGSKRVPVLGAFPLPVEVVPFAWGVTIRRLAAFGCVPSLRVRGDAPFVTDNGNYIVDCAFGSISDPLSLHRELKLLPGVIETGLFIGMANTLVLGSQNGVEVRQRPTDKRGL